MYSLISLPLSLQDPVRHPLTNNPSAFDFSSYMILKKITCVVDLFSWKWTELVVPEVSVSSQSQVSSSSPSPQFPCAKIMTTWKLPFSPEPRFLRKLFPSPVFPVRSESSRAEGFWVHRLPGKRTQQIDLCCWAVIPAAGLHDYRISHTHTHTHTHTNRARERNEDTNARK